MIRGTNIVSDSQVIAGYLELTYPNEETLSAAYFPRPLRYSRRNRAKPFCIPRHAVVAVNIYRRLLSQDQPYLCAKHEAMFKRSAKEESQMGRANTQRGVCPNVAANLEGSDEAKE